MHKAHYAYLLFEKQRKIRVFSSSQSKNEPVEFSHFFFWDLYSKALFDVLPYTVIFPFKEYEWMTTASVITILYQVQLTSTCTHTHIKHLLFPLYGDDTTNPLLAMHTPEKQVQHCKGFTVTHNPSSRPH